MPELPDVEGFRRRIDETARGHEVTGIEAPDPQILRNTSPQGLGRAVTGGRIGKPRRHGKWLFVPVGDATTVWHFAMTGEPVWSEADEDRHRHDRLLVSCGTHQLRLRMMRRFGGVWLLHAGEEPADVTGPLGPDATEIDRGGLATALADRRGGMKSALMDQAFVAGLGNLLADEILWQARIHPRTAARDLGDDDVDRLHDHMQDILRTSIRHGRVPREDDWLTAVRDDDDARCPRDGTALRHATVAGRPTRWCPRCQPGDS